jgi:hypothetical protein
LLASGQHPASKVDNAKKKFDSLFRV